MTHQATTRSPGESKEDSDEAIFNRGYQAQMQTKSLVLDNPYPSTDPKHWVWRAGYLQAFKDCT